MKSDSESPIARPQTTQELSILMITPFPATDLNASCCQRNLREEKVSVNLNKKSILDEFDSWQAPS